MGNLSTSIPPIPAAAIKLENSTVLPLKLDGSLSNGTHFGDIDFKDSYGIDPSGKVFLAKQCNAQGYILLKDLCYYPTLEQMGSRTAKMEDVLPPSVILNLFTSAMAYNFLSSTELMGTIAQCQSFYNPGVFLLREFVSNNISCFENSSRSLPECQWVNHFDASSLRASVSLRDQKVPLILMHSFNISSFLDCSATLLSQSDLDASKRKLVFIIASTRAEGAPILFNAILNSNGELELFEFARGDVSVARAAEEKFTGVSELFNFLKEQYNLYGVRPRKLPSVAN